MLWGHMSRRNLQWETFKSDSEITVAFHGPHSYINPSWYTENDVPTWNYIAVQIRGRPTLIEDPKGLIKILKKTTEHMNSINEDQWDFYIPSDLSSPDELTSAIIGFLIHPTDIVGKFKLSQNRSLNDRKGVIHGLEKRSDDFSKSIRTWMLKSLE